MIYSVDCHTEPHFAPPVEEPQGEPFEWGKYRDEPELNVSKQELKEKGRKWAENVMSGGGGNLDQLAQIYTTEWSGYHGEEEIIHQAADILDGKAKQFARHGKISRRWADAGRHLARYYIKLHKGFAESGMLDERINLGEGEKKPRREAYVQMFKGEFDAFHKSRRLYTNQTYFGNSGLYYLNRALLKLQPVAALPEKDARWFVYEFMGLVPFGPDQSQRRRKLMEAGYPYHVVTDKGLTRELGYVTDYGEMTREFAGVAEDIGCPVLKERAEQVVRARVHFRCPENTTDGYKTLRKIGVLSHRHHHYPAKGGYKAHLPLWEELKALRDPVSKRMCELRVQMHGHNLDSASTLPIEKVKQRLVYKEMPPSDYRLPFEKNVDDYAWADEENAVFMIHNNDEFIWGSFFMWGARKGYNRKGRLRHATPINDRVVDFMADARAHVGKMGQLSMNMPEGHTYIPAERSYTIPPSPPGVDQAETCKQHVDHGRLWFYQANYGDYLIGMNTTSKDAYNASLYELDIPEEHQGKMAKDFISGREVDLSEPVVLGPRSTMVLYVGEE